MKMPRKIACGLAVVEFTILLPILLLMMLAVAELGRAFYQYTQLEKIARDTVRFVSEAASAGTTGTVNLTETLISQAKSLALNGGDNNSGFLPGLEDTDVIISQLAGSYILVEISYDFQPMLFGSSLTLPTFGLGDDINLDFKLVSSAVMRVL